MTDVALTIAGQAGQGIDTASELLARALVRSGYYTFSYPNLMSRIRGGHNFTAVRVSDRQVYSAPGKFNALLALDERSVDEHREDMVEGGTVITEARSPKLEGRMQEAGREAGVFRVPMAEIAEKHGGSKTMANVVGLGALMALTEDGESPRSRGRDRNPVHSPFSKLQSLLKERFDSKGEEVVRQNLECLKAGADYVRKCRMSSVECRVLGQSAIVSRPSRTGQRLLMTGNHAIALGALASGVRFYAGYPMSPSTSIMEYLAAKQAEAGLVMEQVEDEIAAINMVIGASYAGARAMTATSGGGFSLMVEGLGMAAMAELPVVIVIAMRPGPATGFPTRTEQAELLFAISASQDEFPRFVFAPGTAEEAFYATNRAFELAGKFQVPAIVLSDQFLSDSLWTVPGFNFGRVKASDDFDEQAWQGRPAHSYRRYAFTPSGVSPRLRPGLRGQLVHMLGAEHNEDGFQTEDAGVRTKMHEKRMMKLAAMSKAVDEPTCYPEETADCVVVCFGSTYGAAREAVDILRQERMSAALLHLCELAPFPRARVAARLSSARKVITVEGNSTGQLASLLRRETGIKADAQVLKYDGRPFEAASLAEEIGDRCQ
ncbi:2-oxoacid:acceptor oxidoreductase subunit alpha [candidate division WOR-3 bacterium]|uniref:2-oxoacid:acceptor oxidoreductase subunit alpha n=1 Tax=candidate division WOR-3 bacterium TaxID=2052148 RepID=A0A937XI50_UNCW3|nr:2-oxoacid:acceptor oxidoreductase subunit alpha [candidate division WOR-3 bacterium]